LIDEARPVEVTDVTPVQKIMLVFLGAIVVGAVLLSMPGIVVGGTMSWVDAAFMATSAICVTGLATVDVGRDVTTAGHVILLGLIQFGGIGIVTVATLVILAGRRLSLEHEDMLTSTVAVAGSVSARRVALSVVGYTLALETIGAVALFALWPGDLAWGERIWQAVFLAVSAFCNAGFSLFSDNLEEFVHDFGINIAIMVLIVFGGFGFMNLHEIVVRIHSRTFRWSRFSTFLKVSMVTTLVLNGFGALILLGVEWGTAFAGLPWSEKVLAAFFHAVTARTAGFNTVPIATFTNFSLLILVLLMYIGGVSGSCAGGIKVGTVAAVFASFRAYARNDRDPVLFSRRLAYVTQRKAAVLAMMSVFVIFLGVGAVDLLDDGLSGHATSAKGLSDYMFEVVSAAGTVGLSTGITAELTEGAKLVLVALMFIGRLGPLLIIEAWATAAKPEQFSSPEEVLPVG
jgi:trk system potassium uptake protein TrkH